MQHALLGLAIALIVAIAGALAAPAFVNWNDWRASFESQASALAGAPVRIHGRIEATLLPTPTFLFRDVEIGEPDKGNGARAGEVRGVLALGALTRGAVEAEEFVLVRPDMRVAIPPDGRPLLPALGAAAPTGGVVALERISVERGSLTVDRGNGELLVFDDIFAEGEMRARAGPARIDATFHSNGGRWSLRLHAGRFADGAGRVRLTLDRSGTGHSFDADGTLMLGEAPRFDGRLVAARRGASGAAWQVAANATADERRAAFDGFELTLGADAAPAAVAGRGENEPRRGGRIEGALSTRRLDLDRAAGDESGKSLLSALVPLREAFALFDGLPLAGRIGLSVDALVAGGGTLRDVTADIGLRAGSAALERLEARLPGRASLRADGARSGPEHFAGGVLLEAEDPAVLVRWALGEAGAPLPESGALRVAGRLDWSGGRIALDRLNLALGETKLGGKLALVPGEGAWLPRIEAALEANGADLDLLAPLADWVRGSAGTADFELEVRGSGLRLRGRPLGRIDAAFSRNGETVAIEHLRVEDFGGLSLAARGRLAAPVERLSGTIEFDLATVRPDGLAAIATEFLGEDAGRLVRRIAPPERPLKLAGTALGAGSAAGVEVDASGTLGDAKAALAVNFDLLTETLSEARFTLEAADAGRLVALLGLPPGPPARGPGRLEIDLSKPDGGALPLTARLSAPGATVTAEGDLRGADKGRIEPRLTFAVAAQDLRPLLAVAAQAGGDGRIAASGGFELARRGDGFSLDGIALTIAGSRVSGALSVSGLENPAIGGKLAVERAALASVLSLAFGSAPGGPGFWPGSPLGRAPLAGARGTVELEIGSLALAPALAAENARFRLRLGPDETAIEGFTGELAGGKLAADARFVRGELLAFDGRGSLEGFDLARLVAPDGKGAALRGRGSLALALAGNGPTPAALVAGLAGQGKIQLTGFEIERVDPGAVAATFAAAGQDEPSDEIALIALLAPALAVAPLRVDKVDVPVIVAGGVARSGTVRSTQQGAEVSAQGSLDLARLAVDGTVEIAAAAAPGMQVRPGATVRWRGPLAAPERGIDAAALATAVTLRAVERETKRIEERDRETQPPPPGRSETVPAEPGDPLASLRPPVPLSPPPPPVPFNPLSPPMQLSPLPPPVEVRPLPPVFQPEN